MRGRARLALAAMAAALLFAVPAHADITKEQCIDANTKGQDLVSDGKLRAARALLQSCVVPACPTIIRGDCTRRLDELQKLEPSVVFEAKDGAGNDLAAVHVTVDGTPLTDRLDGTPLRVDPGEHVFVFTVADRAPVTRKLVLAERDQTRREQVVIPSPADVTPLVVVPPPVPVEPTPAKPTGLSTRRQIAIATAGVGVVGLGVGAIFGILTGSAWSDQQSDCASASSCKSHKQALSDHSTIVTDSAVSTTAFIAGGVLVAAGAALFFTDKPRASSGATGLMVVPSISPEGSGLWLRGSF